MSRRMDEALVAARGGKNRPAIAVQTILLTNFRQHNCKPTQNRKYGLSALAIPGLFRTYGRAEKTGTTCVRSLPTGPPNRLEALKHSP